VLKNKLIYTITIVYTLAIIVLSFMNLQEIPELNTGFDDKIFHCIAYALFCLVWYLCFKVLKLKSSLILAIVFSIAFGGLIEILQSKLSSYRTTEFFDLLANTLGVLLMAIGIRLKKRYN
tara:strand:- start:186 stop:545 length:360 start_codon:yes stop_codon:yes gene_type:complete